MRASWSRRAFLASAAALAKDAGSQLSLEGYIYVNMANRARRPLADMMDELFATAAYGGFRNVELSDTFFTPALRDRTIAQLDKHKLRMPSVYVGGVMHDAEGASKTIEKALATSAICKPYGCTALVHNPNPKPGGAAKSDAELEVQAGGLSRMKKELAAQGFELRVHHHSPELENNGREWRHILKHTNASLCIDVEFVYRASMDPSAILREAGSRVTELHLRNRTNNSPLQAFEPGDIDYAAVAKTVRALRLKPLIVVELAYHEDTIISRTFPDNVRRSHEYARTLFE